MRCRNVSVIKRNVLAKLLMGKKKDNAFRRSTKKCTVGKPQAEDTQDSAELVLLVP